MDPKRDYRDCYVSRPSRQAGRSAVGVRRLSVSSSPLLVRFSLELGA